eukprot:GILK01011026.1.p1 GENE.GILK01011026.1~~GILK01011026.1.p1  ORF type:complete len:655 (-),score=52.53 GILK01011026.1:12-1976(-)
MRLLLRLPPSQPVALDVQAWDDLKDRCLTIAEKQSCLDIAYFIQGNVLVDQRQDFQSILREDDRVLVKFDVDALTGQTSQMRISQRKRFAVTGDMTLDDDGSNSHYFVLDMTESLSESLVPSIEAGGLLFYFAARSAGKGTRVKMCSKILQTSGHYVILMTLQSMTATLQDPTKFWSAFIGDLRNWISDHSPRHPLPTDKLTTSEELAELFGKSQPWFESRPVVLFIDELDALYTAAIDVKDQFLSVFRSLKQKRESTALHTVVGVGPFSILNLTTENMSRSPFNISDKIRCENVNEEQMLQLFRQWETQRGVKLPPAISHDVYQRTCGHLGLICLCGRLLDELHDRLEGSLTYDQWMVFVQEELTHHLLQWPTVSRFCSCLKSNSAARTILFRLFFRSDQDWVTTSVNDQELMSHLTAEGILMVHPLRPHQFRFSSLFARDIALQTIVQIECDQKRYDHTIPYITKRDGRLDMQRVLETAFQEFSPQIIGNAFLCAYKQNACSLVLPSDVPQEDAYHCELYSVLSRWLPQSHIMVTSQSNPGERRLGNRCRLDLVVTSSQKYRYVLELLSHESKNSMIEHISRAEKYGKSIKAHEVWTIYFLSTTEVPDDDFFVWPPDASSVKTLSLLHDDDFQQLKIVFRDADGLKTEKQLR